MEVAWAEAGWRVAWREWLYPVRKRRPRSSLSELNLLDLKTLRIFGNGTNRHSTSQWPKDVTTVYTHFLLSSNAASKQPCVTSIMLSLLPASVGWNLTSLSRHAQGIYAMHVLISYNIALGVENETSLRLFRARKISLHRLCNQDVRAAIGAQASHQPDRQARLPVPGPVKPPTVSPWSFLGELPGYSSRAPKSQSGRLNFCWTVIVPPYPDRLPISADPAAYTNLSETLWTNNETRSWIFTKLTFLLASMRDPGCAPLRVPAPAG